MGCPVGRPGSAWRWTTTVTIVVAVVLLLVVLGVVAALLRRRKEQQRREHLQERFGGEYHRAVAGGDTRGAEARLSKVERERDRLRITPLTAESRRRRNAQWQAVQADFVEVPVEAVDAADELVLEVMAERGYPGGDSEQAMTLLAADHADTVEHYRNAEAHRARFRGGEGSTEDLRRAFVDYRRLFDVLVQEGAAQVDPADDPSLVDGSTRPDGTPMTADDYVRAQQGSRPAVPPAETGSGGGADTRPEVDARDGRGRRGGASVDRGEGSDGATSTRLPDGR